MLKNNKFAGVGKGMVITMSHNTEYELRDIMKKDIPESVLIRKKMQEAYELLDRQKNYRKSKKFAVKAAISIAVCLLLVMIWGIQNPTVAAQIPLIGNIFKQLEKDVSFPGNYSEQAIELQSTYEVDNEKDDSDSIISPYCKESNNLTITLSEITYDSNSLYFAILVQNKVAFPENVMSDNCLYFNCSGSMNRIDGTKEYYSEEYGNLPAYIMEGSFVDDKTFKGLIQFDWNNIYEYSSCSLTFNAIKQMLTTGKSEKGELGNSDEFVEYMEYDWNIIEGEWSFEIPIEDSMTDKREVFVNECNDRGFGIEKIVINDYELYAVPIYSKEENEMDYVVSIWDANGIPLDSHGEDCERFSTNERDISSITVYILDYYDYMDCKGENYKAQPTKAVYEKTINLSR